MRRLAPPGRRVGALARLVPLVALLAVAGAAQPDLVVDGVPMDPHGAVATDHQMKLLGPLIDADAWMRAPTGVPAPVWQSFIPADNALNPRRIELGRKLYFEKRLSRDGSVSCATCHDVTRGFTDQRPVSEGIEGKLGRRNAPTTMNAALIEPQFLDGRSPTLDHQAIQPILNPVEMGQPNGAAAVAALRAIPEYVRAFEETYPDGLTYENIGRAIASFERTLIFLDAPFDRFLAGDMEAIPEAAQKGWELFNGKARCVSCHPINASNPLGTDLKFHNIGVSARTRDFEKLARQGLEALEQDDSEQELDRLAVATDMSELGRFMVTRNYSDVGAFRTLQLRNIGITGPYMHDGSLQTLWDVMDHYNKGGEVNPYLDGGIEALALGEEEIDQLVAFMFTLTDRRFDAMNQKQMAEQRDRARTKRPFRDDALAHRKKLDFESRVQDK